MSDKKIIAVLGATGSQGGGLVRAILDEPDGPFAVRALTRNPDSSATSAAFAARGAEVVRADLDDEASLRAAFDGAYGAFVVTNYWARRTPEEKAERAASRVELDHAANAARAAKAARLKHVVWSTLEDTRPHFEHLGSDVPDLEGAYKVPHFDAKAEANAYFTGLGIPTTFLETAFYYEGLRSRGPHRDRDGLLVLDIPMGDSVMALVAAEDIGRTAYGIFRAGSRFIGRTVSLAGALVTGHELAALFAKVLGENVVYRPMTHHEMRVSGAPVAEESANMFQFYVDAAEAFTGNRDLDLIRKINPRLRSLEDWLSEHRLSLITYR